MNPLTPSQQSSVDQWNTLGADVTDSAMEHFLSSWFDNIRTLLKSSFPLQGVELLAKSLGTLYNTFTILGSGPSVPEIAGRIPIFHGAIFCSPTAVGALARKDVRPTAIIVADSNPQQYLHIVESKLDRPWDLNVVLPVTADSSWYGPDSIISRDHIFFYLPYLNYMGDVDLGFNHMLKVLFPEVSKYIAQAGSVANIALNFADMCCNPGMSEDGGDPNKRIYVGVDCSWVKGKAYRAPLRFDPSQHGKVLREAWEVMQKPRENLAEVPFGDEIIQSDLLTIGYAVQLFYLMNQFMARKNSRNRFALIEQASKLYFATSPNVSFPRVLPEQTSGVDVISYVLTEDWAYKGVLGLVELSTNLQNRLRQELTDKILHDWREKPEIQNVVDLPMADFVTIVKSVHAIEPSIEFRYNGRDVEIKEKDNA